MALDTSGSGEDFTLETGICFEISGGSEHLDGVKIPSDDWFANVTGFEKSIGC